jgi:hypothetical protein
MKDRTEPKFYNCPCRAPNCVCQKLVPTLTLCELCQVNSHINRNGEHFHSVSYGARQVIDPCSGGREEHS